MEEDKVGEWTPMTDIMDKYLHLKPTYKIFDKGPKRPDQKIVIVTLNNNIELIRAANIINVSAKYVLKHLRFEREERKISRLYREFEVGYTLSLVAVGVAFTVDIRERNIGKDVIIEILMEYGGRSLTEIARSGELKKGDTINIALQLLNTLSLMEILGIPHLDIKPSNIVWNRKNDKVKLIDFGISLLYYGKRNRLFDVIDSAEILGFTHKYTAPELVSKEKKVVIQKIDVFAFGVTLIKLIAIENDIKEPIVYDSNNFIKHFNVDKLRSNEELRMFYPLISSSILKSPTCRPTFNELRSKFIKMLKETKYKSVAEKLECSDFALMTALSSLNDQDKALGVDAKPLDMSASKELEEMYGNLANVYYSLRNYEKAVDFFKLDLERLSLIHICRCRRYAVCRSRWSPYH
eukprot:TRINITY_DN12056_c0_g1_i2.p1 TRINITY_DN12056_c0_g1~~TRINITY_DN12056_c0_g1_i2.p1  ORF type:complete len:408 (+),score=56.34 TRINITY_DN12056_c0_g1_i2:49-1272(+)